MPAAVVFNPTKLTQQELAAVIDPATEAAGWGETIWIETTADDPQSIQHKGLLWPHEEQGIHNHNIRQTQLHAWQKPGDDQCALDEGKRHRQSKQQT